VNHLTKGAAWVSDPSGQVDRSGQSLKIRRESMMSNLDIMANVSPHPAGEIELADPGL
jgi:hypothetical protein